MFKRHLHVQVGWGLNKQENSIQTGSEMPFPVIWEVFSAQTFPVRSAPTDGGTPLREFSHNSQPHTLDPPLSTKFIWSESGGWKYIL